MGESGSITKVRFPAFNPSYLIEENFNYPVSINGKHRTNIEFALDLDQSEIEKIVLTDETVLKWLEGKPAKKIVFVKGKIINLVI
jgi:leucyl-tRNA synthetase